MLIVTYNTTFYSKIIVFTDIDWSLEKITLHLCKIIYVNKFFIGRHYKK